MVAVTSFGVMTPLPLPSKVAAPGARVKLPLVPLYFMWYVTRGCVPPTTFFVSYSADCSSRSGRTLTGLPPTVTVASVM